MGYNDFIVFNTVYQTVFVVYVARPPAG